MSGPAGTASRRTVAVTGAAGLIGGRVTRLLLGDEATERVIGVDLHDPDAPGDGRYEHHHLDVRDPALVQCLAGCDAVVHLAFQTDPMRDESAMRSVNVEGTKNVFESAAGAGVSTIVYTSSAVAYGAHPDNDFPLTEDSPLRANPDFSYGEHKLEIERWLQEWTSAHPDVTVTVLRPAIVCGPGVDNFITRQLELPRMLSVRGYKPPWQFVHVDDVAEAVVHAVSEDLPGAYNVAAEGWVSYDELLDITGKRPLELPEEVAFTVADRMWRTGVAEAPAGELHYVMHPYVMSVRKLMETGWTPRHTNREALAELVEDHRDYVSIRRGVRVRRRDLRIGAGLAGAALAALAIRRMLDDD